MAAEEHVDRASEDGQRKRFCMEPIREPILLPCNERLDLVARGRAWIEELPVEVDNEKVDSIPEPQLMAYKHVGAACFFFALSHKLVVFNGIRALQGLRAGTLLLQHMCTCAARHGACLLRASRAHDAEWLYTQAGFKIVARRGSRANVYAGAAKPGAPSVRLDQRWHGLPPSCSIFTQRRQGPRLLLFRRRAAC